MTNRGWQPPRYTRRLAYRSPWLKRLVGTLACLLGIAVNCLLFRPVLPFITHGNNDFICFYAAAQLSGTGSLYDEKAIRRAESVLGDRRHSVVFTRLPFYGAAISPLRFFSFDLAYWIWQTVSLCAVLVFISFWPAPDRWATAIACCWSLPLLDCFIAGQDITVVLALLAIAISLLFRGRQFAAGCVLSLCSIKYNLFLALPLLILGKRLWRVAGGLAAGGAVLLAVSFAAGGWRWPWQYARILTLPDTTPPYPLIPNLNGLVMSLPHHAVWEAAAAAVAILAAWLVIRGGDLSRAVAATLACGLLVSHHSFLDDAVLLIPVCLLMLYKAESLSARLFWIVMLCPLAYVAFIMPNPPFPPPAVIPLPLMVMAAGEIRKRSSGAKP